MFFRNLRWIAVAALLASQFSPALAWIHGSAPLGGGMLLNVGAPAYFTGPDPYINLWKLGGYTITSSSHGTLSGQAVWDNGTYVSESTGELKNPVPADLQTINVGIIAPISWATYQYEGTSFNNFVGQRFDVTWSGCANPTPSIGGAIGTGGSSSFGSNSGFFILGTGYNNVNVTFSPNAAGCTNNPPTNIAVFQHQYATNIANGEITNPDWRNDVKQFAFLRLMDIMSTNNSGISDSSQLTSLSYTAYGGFFGVALSNGATIASGVLTTSGEFGGNIWQPGSALVCAGCTNTMTINAQLSGTTGGDGTYSLNCTPSCNTISSAENIYGVPSIGQNQANGPKGGIGPDIACKIANEVGTNIEYPIPNTASNQFVTDVATALKACTTHIVKYSYGNENWNFSFLQFAYLSAIASNKGLASGFQYSGYRAAEIFNIIYGIYGTPSGGGRWIGALGSFNATPSFDATVIGGAQAAITAESLPPLTTLVSQVDTAPYTGDFYGGVAITNITAAATPVVTCSGSNCASGNFTNGQTVKLFVSGGTMGAALNNQYATVSNVAATTFQINISTTGLTYGGASSDTAADATIFKLADQSATLNGSTPATYPTKFSYFTQQMSKAILTGSASDASYGTLTVAGNVPALKTLLSQHALNVNSAGLALGQYEGGNTVSLAGQMQGHVPSPSTILEYLINWQFDNGVTGDTTNTEAGIEAALYGAVCSFNTNYSSYPAQFNDMGPQSQFGPWSALRFMPGDESNPKWSEIVAFNSKGPCVDPTPPATWTANYITMDQAPATPSAETFTANIGAGSTYVIVGAYSQNAPAAPTVTVDGVSLNLDAGGGGAGQYLYSGTVPAGNASRSIVVNWVSATFFTRGAYVMTVNGLSATGPKTTANGSNNLPISVTKGALLVTSANCSASASFAASSTAPTFVNNASGGMGAFAYWTGINFNSPIYEIGSGTACGLSAATYR